MAKLYVMRQPDGTFRLRAQRLAGKQLAAHKTVDRVARKDIQAAAKLLMDEVAPRKITRPTV